MVGWCLLTPKNYELFGLLLYNKERYLRVSKPFFIWNKLEIITQTNTNMTHPPSVLNTEQMLNIFHFQCK